MSWVFFFSGASGDLSFQVATGLNAPVSVPSEKQGRRTAVYEVSRLQAELPRQRFLLLGVCFPNT